MLVLNQEISRAHIGCKHAFLDQAVRVVAGGWNDVFNLAAVSEQHHRFCGVEIDGATLVAGGKQHLKHFVQMVHMGPQILGDAVIRLIRIKKFGNIGVRQSRRRMKNCFHELVTFDFASS